MPSISAHMLFSSISVVIAICGNKNDLEDQRQVFENEARAYAEDNGALFIETSAKTAENVGVSVPCRNSEWSGPYARIVSVTRIRYRSHSPCTYRTCSR